MLFWKQTFLLHMVFLEEKKRVYNLIFIRPPRWLKWLRISHYCQESVSEHDLQRQAGPPHLDDWRNTIFLTPLPSPNLVLYRTKLSLSWVRTTAKCLTRFADQFGSIVNLKFIPCPHLALCQTKLSLEKNQFTFIS